MLLQPPEIDVQGAGKQQKTEHAVHQDLVKVDLPDQLPLPFKECGGKLADDQNGY